MQSHRVSIESTGEAFVCAEDVHVLAAMELARCHGIPVGCRNGGCGACKVRISSGRYQTRKMNRAVVSAQDESDGCVLACKTYPQGDITVQVLGRVWKAQVTPTHGAAFNFGFAAPHSQIQPDKET